MGEKYLLALDSGTVKNRAVIFNREGDILSYAERRICVSHPHSGWIEQDPEEIWAIQLLVAKEALRKANLSCDDIAALGITNQRETTILWERRTGRPIYPAINWKSRQTDEICERLRQEGFQEEIRQKTSLVINPYFSATKLCWILENVPGAREMAEKGELLFGTVDTWLIWNLSGGKVFATDYSNASRTMMFHLRELRWDEDILGYLGIPKCMLPEVLPSSCIYGFTGSSVLGAEIPIASCIGNQQADLFGEACFHKGMAKNTYGEGSFFLMNAGTSYRESRNGLITTIAWGIGDQVTYALEGSIFVSGSAISWLKDAMGLMQSVSDAEWMAKQVPDSSGVYFVPSFRGYSAPYWDTQTSGMIIGLREDTNRSHIVRAALESLAYQVRDVYEAVISDTEIEIKDIRVDGGASQNKLLMQFQADILNLPVICPYLTETTALGAAYLAGLAVGMWKDIGELQSLWREGLRFQPQMPEDQRGRLYDGWQNAVSQVLGWVK